MLTAARETAAYRIKGSDIWPNLIYFNPLGRRTLPPLHHYRRQSNYRHQPRDQHLFRLSVHLTPNHPLSLPRQVLHLHHRFSTSQQRAKSLLRHQPLLPRMNQISAEQKPVRNSQLNPGLNESKLIFCIFSLRQKDEHFFPEIHCPNCWWI